MKKATLSTLSILFITLSYAQNKFKLGYAIKNNGEKIVCYINDLNWKNNPTEFEYKLTTNGEVFTGSISNFSEFSVNEDFKFFKSNIDFDISTNVSSNLSRDKDPKFEPRTVFLEALVEGDASLFYYENGNIRRFFYKTDSNEITPLVYKRYLSSNGYSILENTDFRKELSDNLKKCDKLTFNDFNSLKYQKRKLIELFVLNNNCNNSESNTTYSAKKELDFNLRVKTGVSLNSIEITNKNQSTSFDFGNISTLRLALEAEVILPFNNNKWALFLEIAKNTKINETIDSSVGKVELVYNSFEIPFAARHYIYLNDLTKVNLDLGVTWDIISDAQLNFVSFGNNFTSTSANLFLGAGIQYKRFGIDSRFNFSKRGFRDKSSDTFDSNFNNFSLLLAYKIL